MFWLNDKIVNWWEINLILEVEKCVWVLGFEGLMLGLGLMVIGEIVCGLSRCY